MQIIHNISTIQALNYPIEDLAPPTKILFLDIETTGFALKHSCLYLIGCMYYESNCWHSIQWFAEDYKEEEKLLKSFLKFSQSFSYLIHYNGNRFDIPYLQGKCHQYSLKENFSSFIGIDIYRRISPYKGFLKLPNLKQKTIESFLQIIRTDTYDGGQLISVYHEYIKSQSESLKNLLLHHNFQDLEGMLHVLPILAYPDIINLPIKVSKAGRNPYTTLSGERRTELMITFMLEHPLPVRIAGRWKECYFTGQGYEAKLRVNIFAGTLRYFYPNYKDYYYLPMEDTAIHKSVASYIDKSHRQNATASTCYTRKKGLFLPQWEELFTPVFKEHYKDSLTYFELTDDFKHQRENFQLYGEHILHHMISQT
ncbi:hypothetical protein D7X25_26240 [bacterium 1XD42-8]|nr:hypothetical protein D7X25_26240 [bacterium 1XD42-8]